MEQATKRQVLIAGGTGLIGQSLSLALAKRGYTVKVLTRSSGRVKNLHTKSIVHLQWDGEFSSWLVREVEESMAIINLAGESIGKKKWTRLRKTQLTHSRVSITKTLTKACQYAAKKPATFIQASAIGYYPSDTNIELDENSERGNGFLANLTAEWENAARNTLPIDIRLVLIRTGVVLAKEGGMLQQLLLPIRFFVGGWFGHGKQIVSWIHIADEVNAIVHLLENQSAKGHFNLVSPNPVTQKELVKLAGKALARPAWISIPASIVRLGLGQMADELLLTGSPVYPKRLGEMGFKFTYPKLNLALSDLLKR